MQDQKKAVWGWALYDWANSAFATTVMAGFFPVFFKQYWSHGADVNLSTAQLGFGNSIAGLVDGAAGAGHRRRGRHGLGQEAIPDLFRLPGRAGHRRPLSGRRRGSGPGPSSATRWGSSAFPAPTCSMTRCCRPWPRRSASTPCRAWAMPWATWAAGCCFSSNVAMTADAADLRALRTPRPPCGSGVRLGGAVVGRLHRLHDPLGPGAAVRRPARSGCCRARRPPGSAQLAGDLPQDPPVQDRRCVFLLAYWCYIDGVDTIIRMAVDYGLSLGFASTDLIAALLIVQFVGFPAALVFGRLGRALGPRARRSSWRSRIYMGVTVWGAMMTNRLEFYVMAVVIGLVQGGIQALSRSYYCAADPRATSRPNSSASTTCWANSPRSSGRPSWGPSA
ncbi:MAG: MFS transporter [Desulfobacterales bacterium]|nr:MFS transporter [Desulfobacterales bacterium]